MGPASRISHISGMLISRYNQISYAIIQLLYLIISPSKSFNFITKSCTDMGFTVSESSMYPLSNHISNSFPMLTGADIHVGLLNQITSAEYIMFPMEPAFRHNYNNGWLLSVIIGYNTQAMMKIQNEHEV